MSDKTKTDLSNGKNTALFNGAYGPNFNSCNNVPTDFRDITFENKLKQGEKIQALIDAARNNLEGQ
jgi:hypothetical protein